jgi:mannose-6-phosphate isomerase class I
MVSAHTYVGILWSVWLDPTMSSTLASAPELIGIPRIIHLCVDIPSYSSEDAILKPRNSDKGLKGNTKVLAPPMSEFDMLVTELKASQRETIKPLQGPSILVITSSDGDMKAQGRKHALKEGYVFSIGYNTEIEIAAVDGLETQMAYCEILIC